MDAAVLALKRFASGPLQGLALTVYVVLLPDVVSTRWRLAAGQDHGTLLRGALVALSLLWIFFLAQFIVALRHLRHGDAPARNGAVWLAGLVVAFLPFLVTSAASAAPVAPPHGVHAAAPGPTRRPGPAEGAVGTTLTGVPLLLAAKTRREALRRSGPLSDDAIDAALAALREADDELLAGVRALLPDDRDGAVALPPSLPTGHPGGDDEPVVVTIVADDRAGSELRFARPGGTLVLNGPFDANQWRHSLVALHRGTLQVTDTVDGLLRALATRLGPHHLVLFSGPARQLDDELRALCVVVSTTEPEAVVVPRAPVRVELLRATPQVYGLVEPFVATLRRRCVEMVAYLALHVDATSGDRLRTRVLVTADVDASKSTLANTASSVRRSLGTDERGPRLHAVSSAGLYELHGVTIDVEEFHLLVARGRASATHEAAGYYRDALDLVQGEPLASITRGFEWFFVEGHLAKVQRDGEWAALALHDSATRARDYDVAFWALHQGLLLDPENDLLRDALYATPRLREFGGDGAGVSQHQSVGSGRAVAVSWALQRLRG